MDALKKKEFLYSLKVELDEILSDMKHKYCVWTCPECDRILISRSFLFGSYMEKDIGYCIGTSAVHQHPKTKNIWLRIDEANPEYHPIKIMKGSVHFMSRDEYKAIFGYETY